MKFDYAGKIQALLAKAESPAATEAEAALFRAKAEQLMQKYRIEEEELLATDEAASKPISKTIVIRQFETDLSAWYPVIFHAIAEHCGIRWHKRYAGNGKTEAVCVGYEGDVRYAEFLFVAAHLMFATRVDPVWNPALPEEENIYFLRNAGIERRRIADLAWGYGAGDEPSNRSRVQRVYLKECAKRSETARAAGLSHNTQTYREAYARSFHDTLSRRLHDARNAVDSMMGGVVLHGREMRVNEAFYEQFPQYRPSTEPRVPFVCEDCKRTKHTSGKCRLHRPRAWTKRDEERFDRRYNSQSAKAGTRSGREAAEGVIIERGYTTAKRIEA